MIPRETESWTELVRRPAGGEHFAQLYSDERFLYELVGEYAATALERGEAVIIIATPAHREGFLSVLDDSEAVQRGQLVLLDAEETLARFSAGGTPDWQSFHASIGGLIARVRLDYPAVRAYGEMVDVLWQRGERDAAIRLEEFWNDLAELQTFSLLCAYRMDPLDGAAYGRPLDCLSRVHTHLIPARDYARFNLAVVEASREVLDAPLADMLMSLTERHRPATGMPQGQATLLWLQRNMPRAAERVLAEVRARAGAL
jgi:hypothetical protein